MANWNDPQPTRTGFGASPSLNGDALGAAVKFDAGLRRQAAAGLRRARG